MRSLHNAVKPRATALTFLLRWPYKAAMRNLSYFRHMVYPADKMAEQGRIGGKIGGKATGVRKKRPREVYARGGINSGISKRAAKLLTKSDKNKTSQIEEW